MTLGDVTFLKAGGNTCGYIDCSDDFVKIQVEKKHFCKWRNKLEKHSGFATHRVYRAKKGPDQNKHARGPAWGSTSNKKKQLRGFTGG